MGGLSFNSPWFLVLLSAAPLLWWAARNSLAAIGRARAVTAFGLRTVVLVMFVLALAETQTRRTSRALSVIYLLDQSLSIPAAERAAMFQYVASAVGTHRKASRGDRAGVIVFGGEAAVEVAPEEDDLSWLRQSESLVPRLAEATNLAAALKLAQSIFPPDCARRVVIVTDGNENLGAARQVAPQFAELGIGIDVVPIRLTQPNDVAVEKLVLPPMPQPGATIEARVVIVNDAVQASGGSSGSVSGKLRVTRCAGAATELLAEQHVELGPGKNVFPLVHKLDAPPGFYTYEAQFFPDDVTAERTQRNNRATAFANVRGKGRVLFVENVDTPGEFDFLIERLRAAELLVDARTSAQPFGSLVELQSYDTVVLANVARTSGPEADAVFSDRQIETLVRNTQMGCGMVMLGGPNSFGAGGWANTPLEEASPVDFTIDNAKVIPTGALVLVIDKSGSMQGEKIAMSRQAAAEAVRVLGPRDHVGVVAFDGVASWVVPMQQVGQRRGGIVRQIRRLGAGGGTDMFPGMRGAFAALQRADAAVKHMIVLTDGRTQPGDFERLTGAIRQANITVSAVAVGTDADRHLLGNIAHGGGGKFYQVTSPRAIPRVFIKEAMRVAKPLVYEREKGFAPQVVFPHEVLSGIDGPLPPITGFVLTELKENPLVEVALRSPRPGDEQTSTVLASWNYGLGRFVVLTTDAGRRWASSWTQWENYDALFTQIVRWSMRPGGQEGDYVVATEVEAGKIRAIVTALGEDREFLNFLDMTCSVTTPDLRSLEMRMKQTAPGRYIGELSVDDPGSYFLAINPGRGRGALRAGVSLPYGVEFKDKQTNWQLLDSLASQTPVGGKPGILMRGNLRGAAARELLQFDTFRPTLAPAVSLRDAWPLLLVLAACVFFFDVLMRRVAINPLATVVPLIARLRRRPNTQPRDQRIERLRARKAAMEREIEDRRAAARFEPPKDGEVATTDEQSSMDSAPKVAVQSAPPAVTPDDNEEPSYTSRLLEAKRRMQTRAHERKDDKH